MLAQQLRTPQERSRHSIAVFVSVIAWALLVVSVVGALYGLFIAAFVLGAHALLIARVTGNGVRVGPEQLPQLWRRVEAASSKLGLSPPPEVYIVQAGGALNALATKLLSRRFVLLYSDLLEACEARNPSLDDPNAPPTELDFILAHEIGHIACNHLTWFLWPARLVPLLGSALSRAREYTCDACGHAVTGDIDVSTRALAILAGGATVAQRIDLEAFAGQRAMASGFWASVYELNASHPYLPKRVAALLERERPGWAPMPARSGLSYPLAPLFGLGAAGAGQAWIVVLVVGVMSAVAIPAFVEYRAKSRAAAQTHDQAAPAPAPAAPAPPPPPPPPPAEVWLQGEAFHWRLRLPSAAWQLLPTEVARKQNPLADRMVTRADVDAHILVIGEAVTNATLDGFVATVLAHSKQAAPSFQVLEDTPLTLGTAQGRLLHTRIKVGEVDVDSLHVLLLAGKQAFQVVGFAARDRFGAVEPELQAALRSFEVQ